jgi:O-methyltransferase
MKEASKSADRYLRLMQEVLINLIYQDRAMDPWSQPVYDAGKRDSGRDWPQQALTMIGRVRLRSLRECCELVLRKEIPGDFVETGIWRGGACIMMAAVLAAHECNDRKVWGFDSFQGLPPPNETQYPGDRGDQLHRFPQLAVSIGDGRHPGWQTPRKARGRSSSHPDGKMAPARWPATLRRALVRAGERARPCSRNLGEEFLPPGG